MEKLEITTLCISCDNCRLICPESSLFVTKEGYAIDDWSCTLCGLCIEVCPVDCIKFSDNND
tara:strand:+ start:50067 stop:50252 length:186 start_codon:yes stop_codon:yes gene_type:complete